MHTQFPLISYRYKAEPEFVNVKESRNRLQGIDSASQCRIIVPARQAT
jgi:hypothetical protein